MQTPQQEHLVISFCIFEVSSWLLKRETSMALTIYALMKRAFSVSPLMALWPQMSHQASISHLILSFWPDCNEALHHCTLSSFDSYSKFFIFPSPNPLTTFSLTFSSLCPASYAMATLLSATASSLSNRIFMGFLTHRK